ncbi:MAG: sigma-70 family RNA polymerase sigma factor [Flavobacteriales bacterium]|nr:sigma-70 family RNA polymerase sigma factor [Flavobacteriales bacterium]
MTTDQIWEQFHTQLYAFIFQKVKDKDVANDILQDVFLKIHTHISSLRSEKKLKSWLYQISRNTVMDHFRNGKNYEETAQLENTQEEIDLPPIYQAAEGCLKHFLEHIPIEQKEAIVQVYFEGKSQKQLAANMDITYSTLKSRIQRGKQKLAEMIESCCLKSICSTEVHKTNCDC